MAVNCKSNELPFVLIKSRDIFDELLVENQRLLSQLLFANNCVNKLQTLLTQIYHKFDPQLSEEERHTVNEVIQELSQLDVKEELKYESIERQETPKLPKRLTRQTIASKVVTNEDITENSIKVIDITARKRPSKVVSYDSYVTADDCVDQLVGESLTKKPKISDNKTSIQYTNRRTRNSGWTSDDGLPDVDQSGGESDDNSNITRDEPIVLTKRHRRAKRKGGVCDAQELEQMRQMYMNDQLWDDKTQLYKCPKSNCPFATELRKNFYNHLKRVHGMGSANVRHQDKVDAITGPYFNGTAYVCSESGCDRKVFENQIKFYNHLLQTHGKRSDNKTWVENTNLKTRNSTPTVTVAPNVNQSGGKSVGNITRDESVIPSKSHQKAKCGDVCDAQELEELRQKYMSGLIWDDKTQLYTCPKSECPATYEIRGSLYCHLLQTHGMSRASVGHQDRIEAMTRQYFNGTAYVCTESGCDQQVFEIQITFYRHLIRAHGKQPDYRCKYCQKTFTTSQRLYKHQNECKTNINDNDLNLNSKKVIDMTDTKVKSKEPTSDSNVGADDCSTNVHQLVGESLAKNPKISANKTTDQNRNRRTRKTSGNSDDWTPDVDKPAIASKYHRKSKCGDVCDAQELEEMKQKYISGQLFDDKTRLYKCPKRECPATYDIRKSLYNHLIEIHGMSPVAVRWQDRVDALTKQYYNGTGYVCTESGCDQQMFKRQMTFYRHLLGAHGKQPDYRCKHCQKTFTNAYQLKNHSRNHTRIHRSKRKVYEDPKRFKCQVTGCERGYPVKSQLAGHTALAHSDDRPYPCTYDGCNKAFKAKNKLKGHINAIHNTNYRVKCKVDGCDEWFTGVSKRYIHFKTAHLGLSLEECKRSPKKIPCDWPGCEFLATVTGVAIHKRTHTGERPFPCEWPGCDKRFRFKKDFTDHLNIHLNVKPYECHWPGCTYTSSDGGNYRKHIRTKHKT